MPNLDIVRQEIVEAALDVIGPYGRSKAERIADKVVAAFRAERRRAIKKPATALAG